MGAHVPGTPLDNAVSFNNYISNKMSIISIVYLQVGNVFKNG